MNMINSTSNLLSLDLSYNSITNLPLTLESLSHAKLQKSLKNLLLQVRMFMGLLSVVFVFYSKLLLFFLFLGASLDQGNPIALMPNYRSSILVELPNLVMFDDIHVEHREVQLATQIFEGECSFASIGDIDDPPTFRVKVGRMTGFPRPLLVVHKPLDSEAGVAKEAAAAVAKEEQQTKKADPKKAVAPAPKGKGKPTDVPLEPEKKNEAPKEEGFENYKYTLKVRMPFQKNACNYSDTNDGVHTSEKVSWVVDPSDETGAEGYLDFGEDFFVQEVASVLVRDSMKFATLEVELWEEFEIPQAPMQEGIPTHDTRCSVHDVAFFSFHPCIRCFPCVDGSYDLPLVIFGVNMNQLWKKAALRP
jgi:hypothetical protein